MHNTATANAWLSYEAFRAHKSSKVRFVAWKLLAEQMGGDYANNDEFARKGRLALRKIQALYPALQLGPMRGGVRIEPDSLETVQLPLEKNLYCTLPFRAIEG